MSGKVSVQPAVSAVAVIALAVVSAWIVNEGRVRYLWATAVPMLFPATSASASVGAGAGAAAGVIAAAVSFAGSSFFEHAATSRMAELASAIRVMRFMNTSANVEDERNGNSRGWDVTDCDGGVKHTRIKA